MSALSRVVRSGAGRRRMQTWVIGLAVMMAVTASVLAGSLLAVSGAPFDDAFARQRGAHLSVHFASDRATAARLRATADSAGIAAASGPFPTVAVTPSIDEGDDLPPLTLVGRSGPEGAVDALTLMDGRWATRPGEIVLSADSRVFPLMGLRLHVPGLPGNPVLEVVGLARSVTRSADAWVSPSQIDALRPSGGAAGYEMLYRLDRADTAGEVSAGRGTVTAAVPAGAVTGTQSWLTARKTAERETALFVPFLVAFGVLGLVMSVLVVGHVIAGTVGSGMRRIGILKAVGFTPAHVVRAYLGQALIPAGIGTALGVAAGSLLAVPVLSEAADAYGTTGLAVAPWVDAAVAAGVLALVTVTAGAAAWRGGRLRTVDALAIGHTPSPGRGRWAARLPLPRPVSLGLALPFARPVRAAAVCVAVAFGATAVTFAVGLGSSLSEVLSAREHDAADVTIGVPGSDAPLVPEGNPPTATETARIAATIDSRHGTGAYYATSMTQATVPGLSGSVEVVAFTGDASWGGYEMVSGRWIARPGEAVVPTPFLAATGTRVGDTIGLNDRGTSVTVRIVGEVFDTRHEGRRVFTDRATLATAEPDLPTVSHHIAVKPGTDVSAYIDELNAELRPMGVSAMAGRAGNGSDQVVILNSLTAILTLMLVAVAALGVLNGVVLDTRERVRDLGIHKALGMVPRQTIAMVVTSVVVTGLIGGALGVPLGVALHSWITPAMGEGAGLRLPEAVVSVYRTPELILLALGGLLIAVLGALAPAGWAARVRTATALRTE
ncbi:ABC transporter permease [Streptomyces sp. TLI_105]|uniref:ABC transporter permease n=1 Tax=Streptomyces sp. TLI_105 TaxID=1881019 RepID=UPI000897D782|nr:ABC transporter permease [Streptomyces sp. TLI_105]SEC00642.1 putative ABC transport system permease protein [Streptomyces sp. TLI_105]